MPTEGGVCIPGVDCPADEPPLNEAMAAPALDMSASAPTSVSGGSGICDDAGACRCDADAESCAPISLCGDGGTACGATCPGCVIEEDCVAADAVNPANSCQVCDPALDARGWSNNDGATCDDQLFCTTDDACIAGACEGTPRVCEDGVACNGVSFCDEGSDSCSPNANQCGSGLLCNVATGACASTCGGCLIAGVCLETGAQEPGNPCRICDPARSTTGYSPAVGRSCGAGPSACSQQDTCDAQGACRPNDLASGSPCGDSTSSACDRPDTCDGSGTCQARRSANDSPCDDGLFCATGDSCQGGRCLATGNRNCGSNQSCSEGSDRCECQGCVVNGTCFGSGARNNDNACQICDPTRSSTSFSPNVGANCGSGPSACSGQDTCNAQGTCALNHFVSGTACGDRASSTCDQPDSCDGNGSCQARRAQNNTVCDDGLFCTTDDRCQDGRCRDTGTGQPRCPANRTCIEDSDECRCAGCQVGNRCYAAGEFSTDNTCERCDGSRQAMVNQCQCFGAVIDCPSPERGEPNCTSWDFESNTEGWQLDTEFFGDLDATIGQLTTSTNRAHSGSSSLAIRFQGTNNANGNPLTSYALVKIPLCDANARVNLTAKTLTGHVLLVTDSTGSPGIAGQAHVATPFDQARGFGPSFDFSIDPEHGGEGPNSFPRFESSDAEDPQHWYQLRFNVGAVFDASGMSDHNATAIHLRFIVYNSLASDRRVGWRGTIYLDDFRLE